MENDTGLTCNESQTNTPSPTPVSPDQCAPVLHAPRFGTVIPNRIFVGGIDIKTNESDLRRFFSQHGAVKEVKIVIDRAGVSKGYGFVTFETPEDAQKILLEADHLCFRDKKLNIGQAIRKQQLAVRCGFTVSNPSPPVALHAHCGTLYLTTPTGFPYTYHNGVAYFHPQETTAPHWPPRTATDSPVMMTHPGPQVFSQPAYTHYQAPTQCVPGPVTWNVPQVESPVPSSPLLYVQPSELLYQQMELPPDSSCVQTAMVEASLPEPYMDHMVQPAYQQMYLQNPVGMTPFIMPQDGGKEQKFHPVRRAFTHSPVHLKSRYTHSSHYTHVRKDFRPDISEPSPPPSSEPLK